MKEEGGGEIFILLAKIQFLPILNAFLRFKTKHLTEKRGEGMACGSLLEIETTDIHP